MYPAVVYKPLRVYKSQNALSMNDGSWGSVPGTNAPEPMVVLSDSQLAWTPTNGDNMDTLVLDPPSDVFNSDVAAATLKSLDDHEETVQKQELE